MFIYHLHIKTSWFLPIQDGPPLPTPQKLAGGRPKLGLSGEDAEAAEAAEPGQSRSWTKTGRNILRLNVCSMI